VNSTPSTRAHLAPLGSAPSLPLHTRDLRPLGARMVHRLDITVPTWGYNEDDDSSGETPGHWERQVVEILKCALCLHACGSARGRESRPNLTTLAQGIWLQVCALPRAGWSRV
jgi:hypothetical protein